MEEKTKENTGKALGRIASGVFVVTLGDEQDRDGMLATWIGQCAFDPPAVTVCVKKERPILGKLSKGSKFIINVLGKKNNPLFKNFAKPFSEDFDRFNGLSVEQCDAGPILKDSVSYLACTVIGEADAGDHVVVVAQISCGSLLDSDQEPMVHLRNSGFQY